jgi:DNA-binding transcriptional ArsR family regulator
MTFETAVPDPDAGLDEVSALLAALAHPVRLRILAGLLSGDCCVGTMVQCLGVQRILCCVIGGAATPGASLPHEE